VTSGLLSKVIKMQRAGISPDAIEIQTAFLAIGLCSFPSDWISPVTNGTRLNADAGKNANKG
jgi:hypothetical protein